MSPSPEPSPLIFIVDDDAELCHALDEYLNRRGYEVAIMPTADEFLRRIRRRRPALAILDVMMPGTGGLLALRRLRQNGDHLPVIVLTARNTTEDRIIGLTIGADDYIGKPFCAAELSARVQAILRRQPFPVPSAQLPARSGQIHFGSFMLDLRSRTLSREGAEIDIFASDFTLLRVMANHPFVPISRDRLMEMTRTQHGRKCGRSIDVQIARLRRVIEIDPMKPTILQTVRGVGYAFTPP